MTAKTQLEQRRGGTTDSLNTLGQNIGKQMAEYPVKLSKTHICIEAKYASVLLFVRA
jgi:hypothetical protein